MGRARRTWAARPAPRKSVRPSLQPSGEEAGVIREARPAVGGRCLLQFLSKSFSFLLFVSWLSTYCRSSGLMKTLLASLVAGAAVGLAAFPAVAQNYPSRPVTVVVP